jgi:hypothetical protein
MKNKTQSGKPKKNKAVRVVLGTTVGAVAGLGVGLAAKKYLGYKYNKPLKGAKALDAYLETKAGKKAFIKHTKGLKPTVKNLTKENKDKFLTSYKDPARLAKRNKTINIVGLGGGAAVGGTLGGYLGNQSAKEYVPPTQEQFERTRNTRRTVSTLNSTSREVRGWVNTLRMAQSFF